MIDAILVTLRETWSGYVQGLRLVLPRLLAMLSVVAAGWLIAAVARLVARLVFRWLRVARLSERTGAAELLRKAELPPADRLAASAVFWVLFLGFLLTGLDVLGFGTLRALRAEVGPLLPRIVVGLFVLAIGLFLANVVWRVALLAAVDTGLPSARLAAGAAWFVTVSVAAAMALDQIGLARPIVLTAFALVVGAVMLAVALAIGIGTGPLVRSMLEDRLSRRPRAEPDGSSHL